MLRGLVVFTKAQIDELVILLNKEKFKDMLVYIKINSAKNQSENIIPVELSEDEVEMLIDELEPDSNNELRNILTATMLSWRS